MKPTAHTRYKPSGVEWLGEVPEHWCVKKVTYGFSRIGSGTTPKSDTAEYYNGDIPWVTTSELREGLITKTKDSVTRSAVSSHSALKLYPVGTLLFAMYGATIGRLGILAISATLNQACCAFAEPTYFDTRFTFYWLWMRRPILVSLSAGGGQPNLSQDDLRQIRIPAPPLDEQQAIARYLDREIEHLDRLVTKKRALIERLKEKRIALIYRTVTHGLPPIAARRAGFPQNPLLKLSGIPWIRKIPQHWESGNLRRFARMRTGHTPSRKEATYWADCTIPWFTLADVWQLRDGKRKYLGETKEMISKVGLANSAAELLPAGTVVFSRTASIGFSGIMPVPMATTQDFWNWICGPKLQSEYLLLLFRAMSQEFERLLSGSTHKTIYQPDAASLRICVPPLPEQTAIVEYLENETTRLDAIMQKVEEAIERLQEYRAALINAAVTGKIDVRKAAS